MDWRKNLFKSILANVMEVMKDRQGYHHEIMPVILIIGPSEINRKINLELKILLLMVILIKNSDAIYDNF